MTLFELLIVCSYNRYILYNDLACISKSREKQRAEGTTHLKGCSRFVAIGYKTVSQFPKGTYIASICKISVSSTMNWSHTNYKLTWGKINVHEKGMPHPSFVYQFIFKELLNLFEPLSSSTSTKCSISSLSPL